MDLTRLFYFRHLPAPVFSIQKPVNNDLKGEMQQMSLVRKAHMPDIPVLASHHRKMFDEIWAQKGQRLPADRANDVETAYREKLEQQLPTGACIAWVVEQSGQIVASGAASIISLVPVPHDLNHQIAYIHSIFTENTNRCQGCAHLIVSTIIKDCKALGITRLQLNTSADGRSVYDKLGFHASPDAMRLFLE